MKRTFSNAKIDLSDIRPVDPQVLERIKTLEISLKQHHNSIKEIRTTIKTSKNEQKLLTAGHEKEMRTLNELLSDLNRSITILEQQETRQLEKRQELLDSILILKEELDSKDQVLVQIQQEFEQSRQDREMLLQERFESEKEALEEVREAKALLLKELDEIMVLQQEFEEASMGVLETCGIHEAEALKVRLGELNEMILELEQAIVETRNSSQVEEKNADELVSHILFFFIYEFIDDLPKHYLRFNPIVFCE